MLLANHVVAKSSTRQIKHAFLKSPFLETPETFRAFFGCKKFPLYLKKREGLSRQTSQLFCFLLSGKHLKRSAFQNKRMAVSQMSFRARKVNSGLSRIEPLGTVSRKSRNFTGHFRVSQFPLYLKNGEDLSRQTSQTSFY